MRPIKLLNHIVVWFPHKKKKSNEVVFHRRVVSIKRMNTRGALRTMSGRVSFNIKLPWSKLRSKLWPE